MANLLAKHGFEAQICDGPAECRAQLSVGAGALLLTEEALELPGESNLLDELKAQPAWSELPLIILTIGGEPLPARLPDLAASAAGSATLLERPISGTTLLRSVEVALKSRRRQYQVRDLLEEQRRNQIELRQAHERLANRARELETLVQERTAKLVESNEQLRRQIVERERAEAAREALRRRLLNAQEEERRRIARELHDQMGQNLTALKLGLKSLQDAEAKSETLPSLLPPLQELAAQTARDLHRVALELRPPTLDDLGLVKALRNLVETWSVRCGIEADFEAEGYDPANISSEIETILYRIIQEALNNIAKHSRARQASVVLQRVGENVQGTVEDDGCGFDTGRARSTSKGGRRLGLLGIEERLSLVGGSLNVESSPGRGATLIVRIPIPKGRK